MRHPLNGATRVHFVVGDPIAQVKSPHGVTSALQARGLDVAVLPAHVTTEDLAAWAAGVSLAKNVDGIIVTVPHKFAAFELCATTSDRARLLHVVNVMRRNADGSWHGDMFDGLGFVAAMRDNGCDPQGRSVLLVGAGGAGSAIAHALVAAGARTLAIHDASGARRSLLMERLAAPGSTRIAQGSADPTGYDIVLNATPAGMRDADPLPVDTARLTPAMFVGCVITAPVITPLIAIAREKGCSTMTGADMFARVRDLIVDFLVEKPQRA
jgi:shikimate dehydrogenase